MNRASSLIVLALAGLAGLLPAAEPPSADITNGLIKAKICLPDQQNGFYHSTRFDWSGMICQMDYEGKVIYTPWWYKINLATYDVGYDDKGVLSAPFPAIAGPGEEFNSPDGALNFADAPFGGTFIKIGVGILRKPKQGEPPVPPPPAGGRGPSGSDGYDHSRVYEIVDAGKWTVIKNKDSIEFTQVIDDKADGYGYVYHKVVRLIPGKPELVIEHRLQNTGAKPIVGTVYDHNFFTPNSGGPHKDFTVTFPFKVTSARPPAADLIELRDNQLVYLKTLVDQDRATGPFAGFGETAKDYDIRVEDPQSGIGYRVVGDKPMSSLAMWSIRTVQAVEPFLSYSIEPGKDYSWTIHYEYFVNPPKK